MLQKSVSVLAVAVAACFACTGQARAADEVSASDTSVDAEFDGSDGTQDIVVVGSGQTRSVSTLLPSNLDVLPPGTSVQKALNFLPGVSA